MLALSIESVKVISDISELGCLRIVCTYLPCKLREMHDVTHKFLQ
jgi:hypothetical protein